MTVITRTGVVTGLVGIAAAAASALVSSAPRPVSGPVPTAGGVPASQFAATAELTTDLMGSGRTLPQQRLHAAVTAAALRQRAALAQRSVTVPAALGAWRQYGNAPELDNATDYKPIDAIATESGRVQDFAYDGATHRLFAAVGGGGIWESADMGGAWRPLTDGMPATTAGAVGFSPTHGGTIIDGTGDSGYSYSGLGVWRSIDAGLTWQKAAGVPDGLLTFRIAVDPTNPDTVYAATSRGLYRSDDDAASFVNVRLPNRDHPGRRTRLRR